MQDEGVSAKKGYQPFSRLGPARESQKGVTADPSQTFREKP